MGKGAIDDRSHLSLMAVGLQARDHVLSGFDRADVVVSVGCDLVEYAPSRWNPDRHKRIVHIDTQPAEVDAFYQPEVELIGDIGGTLRRLLAAILPSGIAGLDASQRHAARETLVHQDLRTAMLAELGAFEHDDGWPIRPQKAIADLRRALEPADIVVSDVGPTRSGWRGSTRRTSRTRSSSPTDSRRWESRCRVPSRPSSSTRTGAWSPSAATGGSS